MAGEPVGAVVDEHRHVRREPFELALPVAEHRHGTHDERRPGRGIGDERGDELRGLPEPHVVGEARAEAEPPEEREPADPALLIRAQRADEAFRCRYRRHRRVQRVVEQIAQPAGRVDTRDLDVVGHIETVETEPGAQDLGDGRLPDSSRHGHGPPRDPPGAAPPTRP